MNVMQITAYACADCGRRHFTDELARKCCTCSYCGNLCLEKDGNFTNLHSGCSRIRQRKLSEERFEKAEKIEPEEYSGFVFCDQLSGRNEGYFRSFGELLDALEDLDEEVEIPKYCFCCKPSQLVKVDPENIYERILDGAYEDAYEDMDGKDEFHKACKKFEEANASLITCLPDYSRAIEIKPEMVERR